MEKAQVKGPPEARFSEGSRFGAYVVGPCIGRGGMARIYRAEHEGLRRQVALKVLTEGIANDADGHARFLREARIAAAVKHPNVVNIFDVGVQDDIPYLVMELLEGQDLESLLAAKRFLDEATLVSLIVPVVAGLAAVHDAGVVHRDLKPGNIFLARGRNDELEPKVLDFGISKALGAAELKLTFASAPLLGTPFYISPEAIQGREVTTLSDQYSLGVLMYECATGVNPFEAPAIAEVLHLITQGQYVPPAQRNPVLSSHLTQIIERAMRIDPTQRFANLRQMGRELLLLASQRTRITWALSFGVEIEAAAAGIRATAAIATSAIPPPHPLPVPWFKRKPWNIAVAALLLLGILLVMLAFAVGSSRSAARRSDDAAMLSKKPGPSPVDRSAGPRQADSTDAAKIPLENVRVSPAGEPAPPPTRNSFAYQVRQYPRLAPPPPPVPLTDPKAQPSVGTNGAPILD